VCAHDPAMNIFMRRMNDQSLSSHKSHKVWAVGFIFVLIYLLGLVLAPVLPEMRAQPLPEEI
jgi:hypothetical protein